MSLRPTEAEVIREAIESRLRELHTAIPARIVTYDAAKQVADVEVVVTRAERGESGEMVYEPIGIIQNVPVGWPSGGGYSLQFPLVEGDHVWLSFSEVDTAQWRTEGGISQPGDLTRHDLSYCIAHPCARTDKQPLPAGVDALLTVPSGGSFSVSQDGGAPEPVAIASKVAAELGKIITALTTIATAAGATNSYEAVSSVASSNLKAQ